MHEPIEVIYENGMLRPLAPLPGQYHEHQHLTVTIEEADETAGWLADADPTVSLDAVRQALSKIPGPLSELVRAEREER